MTYKQDLEEFVAQGCGNPDCGEVHDVIFLHARCHPGAPIQMSYRKDSGVLRISCRECDRVIAQVVVAEKP